MMRGSFSLSRVARQLDLCLQPGEVARTFAELEAARGGH